MPQWHTPRVRSGWIAVALTLFAAPRAGAQLSFAAPQNYTVGQGVSGFAVGDLNGDGKADLACTVKFSNAVSVLLNKGGGAFSAPITAATGSRPGPVAIADVNGDGIPDLVVANTTSNTVSILIGSGNGSFQPGASPAVGAYPSALCVADLNGDGRPDILTANQVGSNVSVLMNQGGSFAAAVNYATNGSPTSLDVGDLDGDGKIDVLVSEKSVSQVGILLGSGNGTLKARTDVPVGLSPISVVIGDFNADSMKDIAAADYSKSNVTVLNGKSRVAATYDAPVSVGISAVYPTTLVSGDLNGDGRTDLATLNASTMNVSLLVCNKDGSFQAPMIMGAGASHQAAVIADVNADGLGDVILANTTDAISVYMNTTTGIAGLSFAGDPTRVEQGHFIIGTVALSAPAPTGGVDLTLASSNGLVAYLPGGTVVVPEGQRSATFVVAAKATGSAVITATLNGLSTAATLTVIPPQTGGTGGGVKGDYDGDGVLTIADAAAILKATGGMAQ